MCFNFLSFVSTKIDIVLLPSFFLFLSSVCYMVIIMQSFLINLIENIFQNSGQSKMIILIIDTQISLQRMGLSKQNK